MRWRRQPFGTDYGEGLWVWNAGSRAMAMVMWDLAEDQTKLKLYQAEAQLEPWARLQEAMARLELAMAHAFWEAVRV